MDNMINAKQLRTTLADVVSRVRNGARFTVLYRSRPAFRIVPMDSEALPRTDLADDSLYRAEPVGRSRDGHTSTDHDLLLYGADRRRAELDVWAETINTGDQETRRI